MAQGKLFYVMQTIFCIWMARSQILTSTCLNWLKYMIILASSDRKQYQYFQKFSSLCFWSTWSKMCLYISPGLASCFSSPEESGFQGGLQCDPDYNGVPGLAPSHAYKVIHSRLCVHTYTHKRRLSRYVRHSPARVTFLPLSCYRGR